MRALKAMVIGMGVLIVIGVIVLIYAVTLRPGDEPGPGAVSGKLPTPAAPSTPSIPSTPYISAIDLPTGAEVVETRVGDGRIVIRLRLASGSGRLLILDAATGRLIGQTDLNVK
ncbi:unnamed protein product [Laminaria digitata]